MVHTTLIIGHAALPQGMAARSTYDHLALVIEIEPKYGVILNASATLVTEQAMEFLKRIFVGRSLFDGIEDIILDLKDFYRGGAINAIIAALKDAHRALPRDMMRGDNM